MELTQLQITYYIKVHQAFRMVPNR